jgi:Mn2+/Fe2+ NRAMP family transporter
MQIILVSQILNGVLLPFVLVFMLLLINRTSLMGRFVNGPVYNAVAWTTTLALVALTLLMVATSLLGDAPASV